MKKRMKETNPKAIFNPILFWDTQDIDIEKNAGYIISRVLDFGDEKGIKILRTIYPDEKLIEVIKKRRGLMPQTAKFWAVYFNIPKEEITCLKMYCPKNSIELITNISSKLNDFYLAGGTGLALQL